jgi:hypothetical protein
VAKVLEARGLPTKGMMDKIRDSLARRVKNGVLKEAKSQDGWVFWVE